jgi:hypothetical protein
MPLSKRRTVEEDEIFTLPLLKTQETATCEPRTKIAAIARADYSVQSETVNLIKYPSKSSQSRVFGATIMVGHSRKKWRTNAVLLIVLWLVLLISALTILSSVVTPFLRTLQTQTLVSLDWAGYAVSSNNLFPQPVVVGVNGSWTVPAITPTAVDTFSAAWIGIGGQSDTTLIQVGSEHDSISGQTVYALWYELLPDNSIPISNITISPGDKISASVTLVDSNLDKWLIEIDDDTTGACFTQSCFGQNFAYNSSRLTAEWIMERPTVNNRISTLANFGAITFTDMSAQVGNTVGVASTFSNYQVLMQDRQNNQLVTVSPLNRAGTSFTVNYG